MKHRIIKRPAVIAAFIVIFSITGIAYVEKWKSITGAQAKETKSPTQQNTETRESDSPATTPEVETPVIETVREQQTSQDKSPDDEPKTLEFFDAAKSDVSKTSDSVADQGKSSYPIHTNITTTIFWAGEEADDDNKDISNLPSAWDEKWVKHFGGVDSPKKRSGFMPKGFTPKENPFYFALPYNDFDSKGKRKDEALNIVPWAKNKDWGKEESMLKNQWIKIIKGDKIAYAQWEDVGPFKENDATYVFGSAEPASKTNKHAGLDVSPAVSDFLDLSDIDKVDWQFIDADKVPNGPWKEIVTTSQIYWK